MVDDELLAYTTAERPTNRDDFLVIRWGYFFDVLETEDRLKMLEDILGKITNARNFTGTLTKTESTHIDGDTSDAPHLVSSLDFIYQLIPGRRRTNVSVDHHQDVLAVLILFMGVPTE